MVLKVNVTCEVGAVAMVSNDMLADVYSIAIAKIGPPTQLLQRQNGLTFGIMNHH